MKDRETELRDHEVDVKIKKLDGGLRTLVVVTGVVGEIVLLTIHPALFILNLPGLVALQWWQEKKQPPDEHGGGP